MTTKKEHKEKVKESGQLELNLKDAKKILDVAKHHDVFFSKIVFWSALVVIVFANIVISLVLIPFILVLQPWLLYLIVILLGGMVGFLYSFLIKDIGHLNKKHHHIASIIIPIIALANMIGVVLASNYLLAGTVIKNSPQSPFIVAIIFAVAFFLPSVRHFWKK